MEKYSLHAFANSFEEDVYDFLSSNLERLPEEYILFGPLRIGRRDLDGLIISDGFIVALEAKAAKGRVSKGVNTAVTVRTEDGEILDFQDRHEDPYDQAEKHWKELGTFIGNTFGKTGLWFASMLVFEPGSTFDVPPQSREIRSGSSLIVTLDEIPYFLTQLSSRFKKGDFSKDKQRALVKAIIQGPEKLNEYEKNIFADSYAPAQEIRLPHVSTPPKSSPQHVTTPRTIPPERKTSTPVIRKKWPDRQRPWYRSFWFLLFAFIFLNPLWTVLMITDRKKGCLFKLITFVYFIGQLILCAEIVYMPSSIPLILDTFDISIAAPVQIEMPTINIPSHSNTPVPTSAPVLQLEPTPAAESECVIIWVETDAEGLVNKNRSMIWDEVVRDRVAGSEMTAKQFYDQVVERNPTLKADGYVFLDGKTYYLPQCQ